MSEDRNERVGQVEAMFDEAEMASGLADEVADFKLKAEKIGDISLSGVNEMHTKHEENSINDEQAEDFLEAIKEMSPDLVSLPVYTKDQFGKSTEITPYSPPQENVTPLTEAVNTTMINVREAVCAQLNSIRKKLKSLEALQIHLDGAIELVNDKTYISLITELGIDPSELTQEEANEITTSSFGGSPIIFTKGTDSDARTVITSPSKVLANLLFSRLKGYKEELTESWNMFFEDNKEARGYFNNFLEGKMEYAQFLEKIKSLPRYTVYYDPKEKIEELLDYDD